jgi:hypothetical protein
VERALTGRGEHEHHHQHHSGEREDVQVTINVNVSCCPPGDQGGAGGGGKPPGRPGHVTGTSDGSLGPVTDPGGIIGVVTRPPAVWPGPRNKLYLPYLFIRASADDTAHGRSTASSGRARTSW